MKYKFYCFLSLNFLLNVVVIAAPTKTPVWVVEQGLAQPESTAVDSVRGHLYVSNISGEPTKKDHKGWVSKIEIATGKMLDAQWVKGLNAPKGLRVFKNQLWGTDVDSIFRIDTQTKKIKKFLMKPTPGFLNDIAVSDDGHVYATDMSGNRIYHISSAGVVDVFMQGNELENPNGILVDGNELIVATWGPGLKPDFSTESPGHVVKIDRKTKVKKILTPQGVGNLDGLEQKTDGALIVSDWVAGKVFVINSQGQASEVLSGFSGAADIGINGSKLYIPEMNTSKVYCFEMGE